MSNLKYSKTTPSNTSTATAASNTPIWCYLSTPSQIARKYASIAPIWCHISRPRQLKKKFASTFQHAQNLLTRQHSKDSTANLNHNSTHNANDRNNDDEDDDADNVDEQTISNTLANESLTNGYDNSAKSWNYHHNYHENEPLEKSKDNNNKKYTTHYDNYNSTTNSNSTSTSAPLSKYSYLLRRDSSLDSKAAQKAVAAAAAASSTTSSSNIKPTFDSTASRSWYNNSNNDSSNKYLNKSYYTDNNSNDLAPSHSSTYIYEPPAGSENAKRVLHKYAHRTSGAKTERLNCKTSKSSPSLAYANDNDHSLYSSNNNDHDGLQSKWHSTANTSSSSSSSSAINPFIHSNQLPSSNTTTNSNSYYPTSTSASSSTYYPYYHHYSHYHLPSSSATSTTSNGSSYYSHPITTSSSSSYYNYPTATATTAAPSTATNLSSTTREQKWNELDSMLGAQSALLNRLESDFVANRSKLKAAVNISSPLITTSTSNSSSIATTANLPTTTTINYSRPSNLAPTSEYPQSTADLLISKYISNRYLPSTTTTSAQVDESIEALISPTMQQPIPENILESGKIRKVLKYTSGKTTKTSDASAPASDASELKKYNYTEPLHDIIKELNLNTDDLENECPVDTNNNTIEPEISGIKYTNDDFVPVSINSKM